MFTNLWMKFSGFLLLVAGFFAFKSKLQANKIENLEEENEMMGEVVHITNEMNKSKEESDEVVKNEKDNHDDSDWKSRI